MFCRKFLGVVTVVWGIIDIQATNVLELNRKMQELKINDNLKLKFKNVCTDIYEKTHNRGVFKNDYILYTNSPVEDKRELVVIVNREVQEKTKEVSQLKQNIETEINRRIDQEKGKYFKIFRGDDTKNLEAGKKIPNDLLNFVSNNGNAGYAYILRTQLDRAYDNYDLKGSDEIQDWLRFRKRNKETHFFSEDLITRFDNEAREVEGYMISDHKLSEEQKNKRSSWIKKFQAVKNLKIPVDIYSQQPNIQELRQALLELDVSVQDEMIKQWQDALPKGSSGSRKRCKFFIFGAKGRDIVDFFCKAGVASYEVSIRRLLEESSGESLKKSLWGAAIEDETTPRGIILETLASTKKDENIYLNSALVMSDAEYLIEAKRNGREEDVNQVIDFLKFCADDKELSKPGNFYRAPYLGIKTSNPAELFDASGGLNLENFNFAVCCNSRLPAETFFSDLFGRSTALKESVKTRFLLLDPMRDVRVIKEENENESYPFTMRGIMRYAAAKLDRLISEKNWNFEENDKEDTLACVEAIVKGEALLSESMAKELDLPKRANYVARGDPASIIKLVPRVLEIYGLAHAQEIEDRQ